MSCVGVGNYMSFACRQASPEGVKHLCVFFIIAITETQKAPLRFFGFGFGGVGSGRGGHRDGRAALSIIKAQGAELCAGAIAGRASQLRRVLVRAHGLVLSRAPEGRWNYNRKINGLVLCFELCAEFSAKPKVECTCTSVVFSLLPPACACPTADNAP